MSFLTAAFDRSSSGLSGAVSDTSFSGVSSACGVALMLLAMGLQPAFGPRRIAVLPRRRYPKGMATPIENFGCRRTDQSDANSRRGGRIARSIFLLPDR